jgi:hypothetical protein
VCCLALPYPPFCGPMKESDIACKMRHLGLEKAGRQARSAVYARARRVGKGAEGLLRRHP